MINSLRRLAILLFCSSIYGHGSAMAELIRIPGPSGPLSGELSLPGGARDIIVIIPGSGPIDRDGNSPGMGLASDSYRLLADALANTGIASLRIDKRGFYESATAIADPNDVTVAAYADDAARWVAKAAGYAPRVWLAGHSEGGLVALAAAQSPPDALNGLILITTPGRPMGRLLIEQMQLNPANAPLMPEIEAIVGKLEAGETTESASLSPLLQPFFSDGLQRYMVDLFRYDPAALGRNWSGPALILQASADIQVRAEDADLLSAAMPAARLVTLDKATHMLKLDVPGKPFATYTDPSLTLHPELVPNILRFLDGQPGDK